jgi:putative DNA primase/helicase
VEGIAILPEHLDADPWLLNVENGTIDLRTGELHPHRREELITKLAPVVFDAAALCPTWDRFLKRIMGGDRELTDFLRRAAGYALTGDVSAEALFFLVGSGSNGKSKFLGALRELLGDYARSLNPNLLLASASESANRASPDLMVLRGTRLATCIETAEERALSVATVKQITSTDRIPARALYAETTEFVPTHKLFLATNHRPRVNSADEGTWRRIFLVPFAVTIPEEERDPHLPEKLRAELPGILAWAVSGCLEWQELHGGIAGLAAPTRVRQATRSYREEEDVIAPFLADACQLAADARIPKGELFKAYERWAQENKEHAVSARTFGTHVQEVDGVRQGKSGNVRFWTGIQVRDTRDTSDAVSNNSSPARARSGLV